MLVKMSNEREACLPCMAEIVYSKELEYCVQRGPKSKKKKSLSLFRLSNFREKARVHFKKNSPSYRETSCSKGLYSFNLGSSSVVFKISGGFAYQLNKEDNIISWIPLPPMF